MNLNKFIYGSETEIEEEMQVIKLRLQGNLRYFLILPSTWWYMLRTFVETFSAKPGMSSSNFFLYSTGHNWHQLLFCEIICK